MNRRRSALWAFAIVLVITMYAARLNVVNSTAEWVPKETYVMGEWLEPRDGYLVDDVVEDLDGFSLRIDDAKIMTPNEYLSEYGHEGDTWETDGDLPSVLAVTMTIKNEYNKEGGFEAWLWSAVPASQNCEYRFDDFLYSTADDTGSVFRVGIGKQATRTFPFRLQAPGPYFTDSASWTYLEVADRMFHINMTYRPVTRQFVFTVPERPSE